MYYFTKKFTLISLTLITTLCFSYTVYGQKNLALNDFKYITLSGTANSTGIAATQTITVPAGTVWKIVNAGGSRKDGAGDLNPVYYAYILLGDVRISSQPMGATTVALEAASRFPIWLPAGSYTIKLGGTTGNNSTSALSGFVNAIEFTITSSSNLVPLTGEGGD